MVTCTYDDSVSEFESRINRNVFWGYTVTSVESRRIHEV